MWKQAAFYGVLLAVGTLVLQWLDYQRLARVFRRNLCVPDCRRFLVLRVFIGVRAYAWR